MRSGCVLALAQFAFQRRDRIVESEVFGGCFKLAISRVGNARRAVIFKGDFAEVRKVVPKVSLGEFLPNLSNFVVEGNRCTHLVCDDV